MKPYRIAPFCLLLFAGPSAAQLVSTASQMIRQGTDGYLGTPEESDGFAAALATGDFNNDGFDDLAVGAPFDRDSGVQAGAVHVLYGSAGGITANGDQLFRQGTSGVPGSPGHLDAFGNALAVMDINCDGFDDLAVAAPTKGLVSHIAAGAVWLFYGSASGLGVANVQFFDEDDWAPEQAAEDFETFGRALAGRSATSGAGELFVGAPADLVSGVSRAGAVFSIRHSCIQPVGSAFADAFFSQQTSGVGGVSEVDDSLGAALAFGDFDGTGLSDLAVGVPLEDFTPVSDAGIVQVFPDLDVDDPGAGDTQWSQDVTGILGVAADGDNFGATLDAGDFDHDGFDDLVVGVPGENVEGAIDAGAINVIYGSASGLTSTGDQLFSQSGDVLGTPGNNDGFGSALAIGDFDGDGTDDLAVGVPGDAPVNGGSVNVLYGQSFFGLDLAGQQQWTQNSTGIADSSEPDDLFGNSLASGDFNGDGRDDLAVGVPAESFSALDAGQLHIIYGSENGNFGTVGFPSAGVRQETEDNRLLLITVQRSGGANLPLTVGHRLRAGSDPATLGVDFDYTPGTLSWPAGDLTNRSIVVTLNEDTEAEGTEFIRLELFDPSATTTLTSIFRATIQINDDDFGGALQFQSGISGALESAGSASLVITRSGGLASGVSVTVGINGGSATPGVDFTINPTLVTFAANQTTATVQVNIVQDNLVEPPEDILLGLSNPTGGATLGSPTTHIFLIHDDDLPPEIFSDGFESGDTQAWSATVGG